MIRNIRFMHIVTPLLLEQTPRYNYNVMYIVGYEVLYLGDSKYIKYVFI